MRLIKFALLVPFILFARVQAQDLEPATPESQGMDSAALAQLVEYGANVKMDSVVVVRNGRVVAEAYYAPFRKEMVHRINSSTKAVVGTLAGIAIARGDLPGTDATVQELFPEAGTAADGRWKTVKLQHLLDMTAGVEWNEPLEDTNLFPTLREMERSGDWVKFVLDRKVVHTPGLIFNYNSGLPHLVTVAISRRAAMSAEAYAAKHLFEPLGIHNYRWRKDPQGTAIGGWGLYLHTRDMARFGVLYLQGGQWNGKQVVPRAWTQRVFSPKVEMDFPGHRYADFWWSIPRQNAYFAAGFHRQLIMVLPQLGVVAAVTGRSHYPINDLIAHLERATRSATPLPDDAAAQAQLQGKIAAVATAQAAPAGRSVQAALKVGAWQLEDNRVGIRELTLDFTSPRPTYKVKLRSREFGGEIGLNGLFGSGEDAGTPVFTRASWKDPTTLEMEQHWPEEAGQMFYTLRFEGDAVEFTHTNQFGVRGTVRGRPLRP